MIEISVIIPTFNRKESLRKALLSVGAQKGAVFEVIVVDDGSADGTELMLRQEFPSVTYLAQKNQGPAAARNRGIRASRGTWIAFLDSDDEWLEGKLAAQIAFLERHPDMPLCQTEEIWVRDGVRVNPMKKHKKFGGRIFEKCLPLCIISPSAVMIHRNVFDEAGLFDESFPACEDYDLWLRIASRFPAGLIETPYVIKYGGHADQRSHEFPVMDRFRIRALVKILSEGKLEAPQAAATRKVLEEKVKIVMTGAKKRGNWELIREIEMEIQKGPSAQDQCHSRMF